MRINITAKPNSKEEKIEANPDGSGFVVFVKEPPVQGKANAAILRALQEHFHTRNVRIVSGYTSRNKIVEVL